jgi:hypothetical protein
MRKFIFLLIFIFSAVTLSAQYETGEQVMTKKEQREMAREYKNAQRLAEAERALNRTDSMINQHRFVLEADYISGRNGSRYSVSSNLNFIMVDSSEAILQIGSSSGLGYNGVGGITVQGSVTKYEISKRVGKKGISYTISLFIMSSLGMYDIMISVAGSGNADAAVRGNTSGVLNYSGRLVPLNESRVYKARSY